MDDYKRKLYLKHEIKRRLLKSIKSNKLISFRIRYQTVFFSSKFTKLSSYTYSNKRCVVSGRVWSVTSKTNYSRFIFRSEAYLSNIPGMKRASW